MAFRHSVNDGCYFRFKYSITGPPILTGLREELGEHFTDLSFKSLVIQVFSRLPFRNECDRYSKEQNGSK